MESMKTDKSKKRTISQTITGKEKEKIPNIGFYFMQFAMKVMDFFGNFANKNFKTLGIKKNQVVVDYGCGPGRYIKNASKAVGENGKVYAVDIHPLAIKKVNKIIRKHNLNNVETIQATGYSCSIPDDNADVVYVLDAFHMIEDAKQFLSEIARIVKRDGVILIENGHQNRTETLKKIKTSDKIQIVDENKSHVICIKK